MADVDTRGRFSQGGVWPQGGMVSRPMGDRNWAVQQFTGYAVGTPPGTNWNRGFVYRWDTAQVRLPRENYMYDPTDPRTYSPYQPGDFAGYAH